MLEAHVLSNLSSFIDGLRNKFLWSCVPLYPLARYCLAVMLSKSRDIRFSASLSVQFRYMYYMSGLVGRVGVEEIHFLDQC